MAAKTNRTKLCIYLVDRIFTSKELIFKYVIKYSNIQQKNFFHQDINITSKSKMSPLHVLIDNFRTDVFNDLIRFTETFHVFIDKNANLNQQNDERQTLLHMAIAKPNFTAVSILTNNSNINLDVTEFLFQIKI